MFDFIKNNPLVQKAILTATLVAGLFGAGTFSEKAEAGHRTEFGNTTEFNNKKEEKEKQYYTIPGGKTFSVPSDHGCDERMEKYCDSTDGEIFCRKIAGNSITGGGAYDKSNKYLAPGSMLVYFDSVKDKDTGEYVTRIRDDGKKDTVQVPVLFVKEGSDYKKLNPEESLAKVYEKEAQEQLAAQAKVHEQAKEQAGQVLANAKVHHTDNPSKEGKESYIKMKVNIVLETNQKEITYAERVASNNGQTASSERGI